MFCAMFPSVKISEGSLNQVATIVVAHKIKLAKNICRSIFVTPEEKERYLNELFTKTEIQSRQLQCKHAILPNLG
jgi:hypothetical protein